METRRQRAAWAAATAAGVLLAFAPAVVGLRTLSQRDTDRLYAPVRTLVVEELRAGRLPLWNPYEGTGEPLFASGIHSVLHPVSLLAAAVAPSSIDFLILAYLVAGALGAFLLARALGASSPASAGAGLAFALSGYSVSMTGNLVFLAGLSTLPWLLAAARTAGSGWRWGTVATALATACAFFSGDVQVALVGLLLGALLAADAGGRRGLLRALAGMATGLLLAAVQLLATRAYLPLTVRALGLSDTDALRWALDPARILELVIPGLFRGPLDRVPLAANGRWIAPVFAESVYVGAPLLVAAGLGALRRDAVGRRRTGLLLGAAALALLWLALGHHLGARQLLAWVPVWNQLRYSEKLVAPLALGLTALAALGIDAFAERPLSRGLVRWLAAAALTVGALLLAVLAAPAACDALLLRIVGDAGPFYRSTVAAGLPHLLAGTLALLLADRLRPARTRAIALAATVALGAAAAVPCGAHFGAPEARRPPQPLELATDSPTPRLSQPAEKRFDQREIRDYVETTARMLALSLFPAANVRQRIDTLGTYGGLRPRRAAGLGFALGDAAPLANRRLGATHVLFPVPFEERHAESVARAVRGGRRIQGDASLGFELWEVPHRPWAFFATRAEAAPSPGDALKRLVDVVVLGDDATVVVEAPAPLPTSPGRVLEMTRATASLRIEAESVEPSLLVVQDAFWPGWRATIDGEPAEILAADYLVRAVRWPAGRHTLSMVYDPPELRLGLGLTAVGAILILALALVASRRPRTPLAPDTSRS